MNRLIIILAFVCVICAVKGRSSMYKVKRKISSEERLSNDATGSRQKKAYVLFENRSGRTVQLLWRDSSRGKTWRIFQQLKPGETAAIDTYDNHEWKVVEIKHRKSLTINDAKIFTPTANTRKARTVCIIKQPGLPGNSQTIRDRVIDESKRDKEIKKIKKFVTKKFVETLVVVDKSVKNRFDNESEAERYIKVLFSLTTHVFHHGSLTQHGLEIFVVPSKIIFLEDEIKFNVANTDKWDTACGRMNDIAKNEPKKYDHKLFLTRRSFGAASLGKLNGMCNQPESCSLVYEFGFSTIFPIAHEIAHSLGLSDVYSKPFSTFIMANVMFAKLTNYSWAPESQNALLNNTRNGFSCLDNEPKITALNDETDYKRPGLYFSFEKQCDLEYGKAYTAWTTTKSQLNDMLKFCLAWYKSISEKLIFACMNIL
ncbi:A disintegrin and metalloproteinase with thrombospondin motifs 14-like [Dendronephthya gigantea]|uniref:A disintegrin and metalloproteinase with thrombospondin motifs 14-like n=1 Tax=Dendronephthya gigantea TaxID=151771 RepID=UPI0010691FB0|nr:A disintegrin and metalloproteinase with thrombospondin motifs 14-like [Dendronephthya gigantea]